MKGKAGNHPHNLKVVGSNPTRLPGCSRKGIGGSRLLVAGDEELSLDAEEEQLRFIVLYRPGGITA